MAKIYFSPELIQFLEELKDNNTREWFAANKSRYETYIKEPMYDFIADIAAPLSELSKHFLAIPKAHGGSLFRIHRDVRFSKDKRPYKEHVAAHFKHRLGKDAHAPGFYFHIEPGKIVIASGIWMPPSPALLKIREHTRDHTTNWQKVLDDPDFVKTYGHVWGDQLSRPPKGFSKDEPHLEDIKRKSFFAVRETDSHDLIFSKNLLDDVVNAYKDAMPLLHFLGKALEVPV